MHLSICVLVGLISTTAFADLVCLGLGLLSTALGLACFLEPTETEEAVSGAVTGIQQTIYTIANDTEKLIEFDLTHNPIAITYDYLEADDPQAYLEEVGHDYGNLTIGFGKETANQALSLMKFNYWYDVATCSIAKGNEHKLALTADARRLRRRDEVIDDLSSDIRSSCFTPGFNSLATPKGFNITDPNQQIGSTISDVATLLVPAGPAETLGEAAVEIGYDLVIPGAEDTARIYKSVDGTAAHFASESEALGVSEKMQEDSTWASSNCGSCSLSALAGAMHAGQRLSRRGNVLGICCKSPQVLDEPLWIGDADATIDPPWGDAPVNPFAEGGDMLWGIDAPKVDPSMQLPPRFPNFDPVTYRNLISEDVLQKTPDLTPWDFGQASSYGSALEDLAEHNTAVIKWSPELKGVMTSADVFKFLRGVFEGPRDSELAKELNVFNRDGELRLEIFSGRFMTSTSPQLAPLQKFVTMATDEAMNNFANLQKWAPGALQKAKDDERIAANIEFFYVPPSEQAVQGVDTRGLHWDRGYMQVATADTPGLVVKGKTGPDGELFYSRVPVVDDASYYMKATLWDIKKHIAGDKGAVTMHSVFGPEMAAKGRVSMVLSIFDPSRPYFV